MRSWHQTYKDARAGDQLCDLLLLVVQARGCCFLAADLGQVECKVKAAGLHIKGHLYCALTVLCLQHTDTLRAGCICVSLVFRVLWACFAIA